MKKLLRFCFVILGFLSCSIFSATAGFAKIVEVPGASLPGLLGQSTSAIRAYAVDGSGQFQAIPFQVDERNAVGGAWIMDQEVGKTAGAGVFDTQDVLLFQDEDAGSVATSQQLAPYSKRWQLTTDRVNQKTVYIVLADPKAPLSTKSYVSYDAAHDRVHTAFYEMGFQRAHPLVQNWLVLRNGAKTANLLDRFKVRFNLAIKNFFDFKIDEEGVEAQVAGFRVGPIRVIRRVVAAKKLGPINVIPKSQTDFLFYPIWLEVPTKIRNPIDGPKFLEEKTTGISGYDFSKAAYGSVVYSSLGGGALTLDGIPNPQEKQAAAGAISWWSLSGPLGSLVLGIQNDPKLEQMGVQPLLTVIDDAKRLDPPEDEAGACFVGFDLPYYKIPKGSYVIQIKQVFPWRFTHGQEASYLQEANTVAVQEIKDVP